MAKKRVKRSPKSSRRVSRKSKSVSYSKSRVPGLVKALSILFYIAAVFTILAGLVLFVGSILGTTALSSLGIEELLKTNALDPVFVPIIFGSLIIVGLILIAFGVLHIFIGVGLWKGRQWARIVTIILMAIGFITAIFSLDFISLAITGLIGGYLIFSKHVRSAFR